MILIRTVQKYCTFVLFAEKEKSKAVVKVFGMFQEILLANVSEVYFSSMETKTKNVLCHSFADSCVGLLLLCVRC